MKRGDIVTVALRRDHGKPRPALAIESGRLPATEKSTWRGQSLRATILPSATKFTPECEPPSM